MRRRHHDRRRAKQSVELDMTTFLNLMVVLVPFLLITAVFSRITIVELSMPSASAGKAPSQPRFAVEVIVRERGLELTNGTAVIASIPKVEGEYDLEALSELVMSLKHDHPDKEDASVLLEPTIEYDHLIQVMDAVRSAELVADDSGQTTRVALFTELSIGDAP
jgi:biopolymer transport protein ExbD